MAPLRISGLQSKGLCGRTLGLRDNKSHCSRLALKLIEGIRLEEVLHRFECLSFDFFACSSVARAWKVGCFLYEIINKSEISHLAGARETIPDSV